MPRRLILAIDQGSTNSKAVLFDEAGRAVGVGARALTTRFPKAGWVEQDPLEIWSSVVDAARQAMAGAEPSEVAAIGISNQRESTIAWDRRTGQPLGPCITWQCRRTSEFCESLRLDGQEAFLEATTGLTIDPLFSASKMRWLLNSIADGERRAAAGELCLGTVDSWLVWKLTGGRAHATDASNASRTQLLDLATGDWSLRLLEIFGVPAAALPQIHASAHAFGVADDADFPCKAPITGVAGDSHAAMFGHAAFEPGVVKATFGTGSSLMTLASDASRAARAGLSATIAWRLGETPVLAIEGNIASTGATLEWAGRLAGATDDPGGAAATLAASVPDSDGLVLVPAFAGLGAPHWDDQARGLICGLTRGSTMAHVARAALDSIAFQIADVFEAMEGATGSPLAELRADGGASRNDALMQLQADILGRPIVRDRSLDLSAKGAAYLAGLGVGVWDLDAIRSFPREIDRFEPRMAPVEARAKREDWRIAIARTKLRLPNPEERP